jgi:predicted porin
MSRYIGFFIFSTVFASVSSTALAQSDVRIYGVIDTGFSHRGDHVVSGTGSKNSIDTGISAGNRLGFSGSEDLDNGLKAIFRLEAGFYTDTGTQAQGGRLFGRQVYLGLSGAFGTLVAGRLYTPHDNLVSDYDPFLCGTVGQYANTYGSEINGQDFSGLLDPTRIDNAIAYTTPDFSGLNLTLAYSTHATGQENTGNGNQQSRVFAISPRYVRGPIDIGINYHVIDVAPNTPFQSTTADPNRVEAEKLRNWVLGGAYDFGPIKLSAFYSESRVDLEGHGASRAATGDFRLRNWLLGVLVPYGKHSFLASYNHSRAHLSRHDAQGDRTDKAQQWALGYRYPLSKRTNFYASYAAIRNSNQESRHTDNALTRTASVGDAYNGGSGYQNGWQFGIRHNF